MIHSRANFIAYSFFICLFFAFIASAESLLPLKLPFSNGESFLLTQGYNEGTTHKGTDRFALDFTQNGCDAYGKSVLAVADGKVKLVRFNDKYYGNEIIIEHADNSLESVYAHLSKISVLEGREVKQGEAIGLLGNSGNVFGTACKDHPGTHLHFVMYQEVKQDDGTIKLSSYQPEPMSGYGEGQTKGVFASGQWYESDNSIQNKSWWRKIIDFILKIFKTPESANVVQNSIVSLPELKKETNQPDDPASATNNEKSNLKEATIKSFFSACNDDSTMGLLKYSSDIWEFQQRDSIYPLNKGFVDGVFVNKNGCQVEVYFGPGGSFCGLGEDKDANCSEQFDKLTISGNKISRGFAIKGGEFMATYGVNVDDKNCCNKYGCGYYFNFFANASNAELGNKCMADFEGMLKTFRIKKEDSGKEKSQINLDNGTLMNEEKPKTETPKNDCEIALTDPRVSPEDQKKIREVVPEVATVNVGVRLDTVSEPLPFAKTENGDINPAGTTLRTFFHENWFYAQFNEDGSAVVYSDYYGCGKYAGKYLGYLYHGKTEGSWSAEGQKILFTPRYINVGSQITIEISDGRLWMEENYFEPPSSPGGLFTAATRMVEWVRIK